VLVFRRVPTRAWRVCFSRSSSDDGRDVRLKFCAGWHPWASDPRRENRGSKMSPRSAWLCACVLHEASAHGSSSESESAGRLLRGSVLFTCADRVRAHFWCGMLGCAILGPAKLKCHRPASGLRYSAYTRKHILAHFANTCSRRLHRHRLVRKAEIVLASHAHLSILEFRQIIVRNARRRKKRALLRACSCPDQREKAFGLRHVTDCPPSCQRGR
jgi:hypothetical protein